MANLDDFFAKKDKKKKKGFSKANADVLIKNIEESERKSEQKAAAEEKAGGFATSEATKAALKEPEDPNEAAQKSSSSGGGSGSGAGQNNPNDDDWKVYVEEKKDYSNLKIAALKIGTEPAEPEHEINEETGEKVFIKKGSKGVWKDGKRIKGAASSLADDDASPETSRRNDSSPLDSKRDSEPSSAPTSEAKPASSSSGPSSYVPPHMRGGSGSSGSSSGPPGSSSMTPTNAMLMGRRAGGRNRAAPDISNEISFPSLGGGDPKPARGSHDQGNFEEVRSWSGPQGNSRASGGPRVTLDNKFAALRD